jgi:autotransporter-associated beta strand protein
MSLTAGGVSVNPLATTQLGLNATGTYTYSTPLALASSSGTVRSQVNLLQPATAIWGGAVSVAGTGTTGVIELNTQAGGNLIFANPMTGTGYGGAVQLGGASGAGALNGAVTLAATNSRIVKVGGSVWSLGAANAGNAWSATQIQAGVLVTTLDSALASSASLTLGTTGTATVGTLDLYNSSQSVSGLTTATDDSLVNPADNRVGLGDGVGPGAAGTLTYAGTTTSFAGSLVDNVGVVAGKQLSLTVSGGGLTLQSANTYSGATLVTGGTLALGSRSGGAGGGFTNFGSFASSPTVTVRSGANLNVTGATGGLNSLGGQFAPVANQVLRGEGAVTGATTIQPAATIRGGEPGVSPNGQLTVVGPLAIQGGTVGSAGGQWVVDLNGTTVSNSLVGRLAVTGGNTLNFDVTGGPVTIRLEGIGNLPFNQPYTFDVATAGGFARNGTSGVTSYTYGPGNDFVLDDDSAFLTGYVGIPTLTVNSGTLTLGFTPVPEPGTVLAVAAVGLGAVRLRRRILAG